MRASNALVLGLTLTLGFFIFFSSYLALDRHIKDNEGGGYREKMYSFAQSLLNDTYLGIEEAAGNPINFAIWHLQSLSQPADNDANSLAFFPASKLSQALGRLSSFSETREDKEDEGNDAEQVLHQTSPLIAIEKEIAVEEEDEAKEVENILHQTSALVAIEKLGIPNTRLRVSNIPMRSFSAPLDEAVPDPSNHLEVFNRDAIKKPIPCRASYEPTCEMYFYVRFWNKRFVAEDCYQSPLRIPLSDSSIPLKDRRYLVFEPDRGGWNNIRMAAETAMIIAHASGRTLVLPPEEIWYLLDKNRKKDEDNMSTFTKFFDFSKVNESMDVITMKEYLLTVGMSGLLSEKPPMNRVNKIGVDVTRRVGWLWEYLERTSYVREWEPGKMFLGFNITFEFPKSRGLRGDSPARGRTTQDRILFGQLPSSKDVRVRKQASHDRKLVPYDAEMDSHRTIYFPGDYRGTHRLLTHFYAYVFFADQRREHFYKRLVRDRLHYHDSIFCAAGKVVRLIHEEAAALSEGLHLSPSASDADRQSLGGNTNKGATYFAFHIRRGDFQYKHTKLSAEQIVANTFHLFELETARNRTNLIYLSTDERDKSFFEPFRRGNQFNIRFLSDYYDAAKLGEDHLNQNHIGMIEQIICANAHTFIGTPLSTFTGYITRMRGYYRDHRYSRTFYTMREDMYQLHQNQSLPGLFGRESLLSRTEILTTTV